MRKLIAGTTAAVFALSIASGAVFAGKGDPSSGNKYGNENKKDRGCPSDYSFTSGMGLEYDLNGDGWVCYKVTGDEYSFIDNITNTDDN